MDIAYAKGTPELRARYQEETTSNATDHIRFDENCFSLFALVDGRPVGVIGAHLCDLPKPLRTPREAYIDIVEVLADWRRRGIGTALVEGVMEWARENGAAQARSWSEEIRTEALMLWGKLGFTFSRVDLPPEMRRIAGFYVAKRL
jgi:GNAT superfamily N-acetyltransferase